MNENQGASPERKKLRQKSVDCYGTSYVLGLRADRYEFWLRASTLVGTMVPIAVGACVIGAQMSPEAVAKLTWLGGILLTAQAVLSGLLVVLNIDGKLRTTLDSFLKNRQLAEALDKLCVDTSAIDFEKKYSLLIGAVSNQDEHDEKFRLSDKELRQAARSGFRRFQQKCGSCNQIPKSDSAKAESSTCPYCGDLK